MFNFLKKDKEEIQKLRGDNAKLQEVIGSLQNEIKDLEKYCYKGFKPMLEFMLVGKDGFPKSFLPEDKDSQEYREKIAALTAVRKNHVFQEMMTYAINTQGNWIAKKADTPEQQLYGRKVLEGIMSVWEILNTSEKYYLDKIQEDSEGFDEYEVTVVNRAKELL